MADTAAAPIEQQVNGVENLLYVSSQSSNDGSYTLDVTFEVGTDAPGRSTCRPRAPVFYSVIRGLSGPVPPPVEPRREIPPDRGGRSTAEAIIAHAAVRDGSGRQRGAE